MGEKRKPGRPSKYEAGYQSSYAELGHELALLGLDEIEIASVLEVSPATLTNWKQQHEEFLSALKEGKQVADGRVTKRLYERAMGYEHDEIDIRVVDKAIVQTPIRKYYPPDTTACIFWLKNRQRALWRDKVETGVTDKEGNDVEADPVEVARQIAFMFATAEQALKKRGE